MKARDEARNGKTKVKLKSNLSELAPAQSKS